MIHFCLVINPHLPVYLHVTILKMNHGVRPHDSRIVPKGKSTHLKEQRGYSASLVDAIIQPLLARISALEDAMTRLLGK